MIETNHSGRHRRMRACGAIVLALSLGLAACSKSDDKTDGSGSGSTTTPTSAKPPTERETPITYNEAKAEGVEGEYTWSEHCDTETGRLKMPLNSPPPCVPLHEGDNGGDTYQGVTADSITVARYVAKADPQTEALTRSAGAYDDPADVAATAEGYNEIYASLMETYGRSVTLEAFDASGGAADEVPARADADKVADGLDAFAALGGPGQVRAYAEELARKKVMCIGTCLIAQPESFYAETSPYVWGTGPSPEQAADHTVELIVSQLNGKNAEFGGDAVKDQTRKFALLTYDTPDGNFAPVWDNFAADLDAEGIELATRVDYFLDIAKAQEDARGIITKLKQSGATSVVFSGDPFMPIYFTQEATAQDYFPEWVLAGTVYADTNVFGRRYDQAQWEHALGIGLIPTRVTREKSEAIQLWKWYFGDEPPAENTAGIIESNIRLLYSGLALAGPNLTPENFRAGVFAQPLPEPDESGLRTVVTWGDKGVWPNVDYNGLDNAGAIWWDPTATGKDETGADGSGMYRLVDGGRRFMPGEWPSEPISFFDPEGTAVEYVDDIPPSLFVDIAKYPSPKK